jgi:hypothetical protein
LSGFRNEGENTLSNKFFPLLVGVKFGERRGARSTTVWNHSPASAGGFMCAELVIALSSSIFTDANVVNVSSSIVADAVPVNGEGLSSFSEADDVPVNGAFISS